MAIKMTNADAQLRPDPRFNDMTLSRFINCIMSMGKKATAQRIVYDAMEVIQERLGKETSPDAPKTALELFHRSIENVKPFVEVRSKRIGGANYQVPMQVKPKRRQSLAFRWIIDAARGEKGKPFEMRLAKELYEAANGEGKAVNTREDTHRMAEANKAFAHYRW